MEELSVYMTGARELERTEWGTIVYVCEEGHKGVKKKSDSRQKRTREEKGGEWKKRRQSNRGVKEKWLEGLRDGERGEKSEREKYQGKGEEKRETVKAVG